MSIIKVMDINLSNKIAAGEVVERLMNIVKELVENAIDAKASEIKIELTESGLKEIKVIDNGCGMDEEVFKNINKMFYTTKKNGTGIGLPLSNEIIKLHNGRINLYSKKGEGTTVEIIFNKIDMI